MKKVLFLLFSVLCSTFVFAATYTVAGSSVEVFGKAWDVNSTQNDMSLLDGETDVYTLTLENKTIPAGVITFKIVEDRDWKKAWPSDNYEVKIDESGIYTFAFSFNSTNHDVGCRAQKVGDAEVIPTVKLHGNFSGSWKDSELFNIAEDKKSASLKMTMKAGNYDFKIVLNGTDWRGNGYTFHRGYTGTDKIGGGNDMKLQADVDGDYVFTWTFASDAIEINFPSPTAIDHTALEAEAVKRIENGQILIIKGGVTYNAFGQIIR